MSVIHISIPTDESVLAPERQLNVNINGAASLVDTYRGSTAGVLASIPTLGTPHPEYGVLSLDDIAITEEDGGMSAVRLTYKGAASTDSGGGGGGSKETYSFDVSVNEEPILSHPKVKDLEEIELIALQQIINGQVNKEDGAAWADDITSDNGVLFLGKIRQGITAYLVPTVTYTETGVSNTDQSSVLGDVGRVNNPPGVPNIAGRNWMFMGLQQTEEGDSYSYTKNWLLSGPGGWDADVYDYT